MTQLTAMLKNRITSIGILFLCGLFPTNCFAQFSLWLQEDIIRRDQGNKLHEFLKEAESLLPPTLKDKIGRPIAVRFLRWDDDAQLPTPNCDRTADLSHEPLLARGDVNGIELNAHLIEEIYLGRGHTRTYSCRHGDMYQMALAAVVNQVAHIYDGSNGALAKGIISGDWLYRKMTGWIHRQHRSHLFIPNLEFDGSAKFSQSPDLREVNSPEDHAAINIEYFLLDPSYGCHRPTENAYFISHFDGFRPFPQANCQINNRLYFDRLAAPFANGSVEINPDRIYEVHSLRATGGDSISSHFGHMMLKLVVCAPGREKGPDCRKDIEHHLVIDFRFSNFEEVSPWKAITGGYPSRAFIVPFTDVVKEYNWAFRHLISLPIPMSDDEKTRLVYKTLEDYWDYRGKYYLLNNSCVGMSVRLLKVALFERKIMRKIKTFTPHGMQRDLADLGLVDPDLFNGIEHALAKGDSEYLETMKQKGFFFESSLPEFETAYEQIRDRAKKLQVPFQWDKIEDYLGGSYAHERASLADSLMKGLSSSEQTALAASFYKLEVNIEFRVQRYIQTQAFSEIRKVAAENHPGALDSQTAQTLAAAQEISGYMRETLVVPPNSSFSYSIPNPVSSTASIEPPMIQTLSWMSTHLPDLMEENKQTGENVKRFSQQAPKLELSPELLAKALQSRP